MTQPLDQRAQCKAMGKLDDQLGEFWMENPWEPTAHNLSAFERNRILLNVPVSEASVPMPNSEPAASEPAALFRRRLRDVSTQSGADLDSDSRGVVSGDFNSDGRPDLIIRSSGGGPVRLFENRWPQKEAPGNWLKVSLRGSRSNSQGLGARLKLKFGDQVVHRSMQRVSSFMSQQSACLLIGLGHASMVDQLTVDWPSGETQVLTEIAVGQHLVIREGGGAESFGQVPGEPDSQ
ncbi:MAG: ASPIC/UnbV domain-containing protein [Rhodopirellula sp.]|nr:ASPIC/UnbV domain-containing protein [Rhodopirellula sp.]